MTTFTLSMTPMAITFSTVFLIRSLDLEEKLPAMTTIQKMAPTTIQKTAPTSILVTKPTPKSTSSLPLSL
ncbi:unnamed protein product [Prunus armeniaca]|uniref:Uncharacterized protein n=1 Tax=Prunus armeniaca TaxID=36596 RepID=A0A6J5WYP3_PRUAR|nr:unnamed protein product [Prunus armeniaca]